MEDYDRKLVVSKCQTINFLSNSNENVSKDIGA